MTAAQNIDPILLQNENVQLRQTIEHLEEQLNWFKRQLFGKKSERDITHVDAKQLELDGFESLSRGDPQTKNIAAHSRRKPENKGTKNPSSSPKIFLLKP